MGRGRSEGANLSEPDETERSRVGVLCVSTRIGVGAATAGFKPENLGRAVSPRTPALNT